MDKYSKVDAVIRKYSKEDNGWFGKEFEGKKKRGSPKLTQDFKKKIEEFRTKRSGEVG